MALHHTSKKHQKRERRHRRVRAKIKGTGERPRISVFRSNCRIWVQMIDDKEGKTILAVSDREVRGGLTKCANAAQGIKVGMMLAEKAKDAGIAKAVFDRGGYHYHGVIRAVADGARKGGLLV